MPVPVNESVFAALPVLHSMGVMLFDPCWAQRAHVPQACELLHVIAGEVTLELAGKRYHAGPGDVLLVPSGVSHRDDFDLHTGLQVFMVFFAWEAAEAYFNQVSNDLLQRLPAAARKELAQQVERLRATAGGGELDQLLARARLHALLISLLCEARLAMPRRRDADRGRRRRALMEAAERYLQEHYTQPVSLDDLAKHLDISTFYLSHLFSEESTFKFSTYLTRLRMEKARELLEAGDKSIAEVAQSVGYENGNYFTKVFRKYFGSAPSELRGK